MKDALKILLCKLLLGPEGRGALLVWVVLSALFILTHFSAPELVLVALVLGLPLAIIFARYPDLDIPFHLLRRELLRRALHFKTISRWWAGRHVTAFVAFVSLVSLTLAPLAVLDAFGAQFDMWIYVALFVGCVIGTLRAWIDHGGRLGAHWIYGHYPLVLLPAAYAIGHGIGEVIGLAGWYFGLVCALSAAWHFVCDAMQEDLGVPWLGPLYVEKHLTARGTVIRPKVYFLEEQETFFQRFELGWFDELVFMAQNEGVHD
jgi:hypothetical protein